MLFLALALAAVVGLVRTREKPAAVSEAASAGQTRQVGQAAGAGQASPSRWRRVDTTQLLTAHRLAALVVTPEERELAHQAESLADHAVDLAFAEAFRQAADEIPEQTPEVKARAEAKRKAEAAVAADGARIRRLTDQLAGAAGEGRARIQDQIEVATAQQELDRDELDMAAESLERAGGDPQAQIKRLKEMHDVAKKDLAAVPSPEAAKALAAATSDGSMAARLRAWNALREKRGQIAAAEQEARDRIQRQTTRRAAILQRVRETEQAREAAKATAATFAQGAGAPSDASRKEASATVDALKQFTDDQRRVTMIGRRIQDGEGLAAVYASWGALVDGYSRTALHRLLEALLSIALVLLATFLAVRGVDHVYDGVTRERERAGTLRTVVKLAVQAVGALVILFIVIGVPGQVTTILGLAGAGLTVAMKDFIVAFFGWFVLMGKNGIRVGDWVEIKGVGGEVVEIGLLHTVLLETGAWDDAGHPTGRRVSFVNSFAIEGHYFNFSTSGQWMWDDLRLVVPVGQDPYPILDGVQTLVERETAANAKLAEQEWRTGTRYRVKTFSAVPGFTIVPSASGVEIHVRYVTRAPERHEVRRRLYREVVALLHGKQGQGADAA